jgi:uncharacterized NAD(P)/FAD-binding protein YdhS
VDTFLVMDVDVLIAGGGASGTLVALHLLRTGAPVSVLLADEAGRHGRGIAYATSDPAHRLNVPVGRMSAVAGHPGDFLEWLRERGEAGAHDFVARHLYGTYLRERLARARLTAHPAARLEIVTAPVRGVERAGERFDVRLGEQVRRASAVVLAVGHGPVAPSPSRAWIASPWDPGALDRVRELDDVLLLGTGLTMVDTVLTLVRRGHRGRLVALSRHGWLPQEHSLAPPRPFCPVGSTVRGILRELRDAVEEAAARGEPWQSVIDGFRPEVQGVWARLEDSERRRFLRHALRLWEVHRHRIAPQASAQLQRLQRSGRLRLHRGRPVTIDRDHVRVRCTDGTTLRADRGVDCTGPATPLAGGLLRNLIERGLARPDLLLLGIDALPGGEVLDAAGTPVDGMYALGPPLRGVLWETTAIPEIRLQAVHLARRLTEARAMGALLA